MVRKSVLKWGPPGLNWHVLFEIIPWLQKQANEFCTKLDEISLREKMLLMRDFQRQVPETERKHWGEVA